MVTELVCVGTELLLGNIVNTNAAFLSEKCALLGLSMYHQSVVGDNEGRLEELLHTALDRSDVVILSGGLGPTKDDLTKETAAKVMGMPLKEDVHSRERIEEYFKNSSFKRITENNWKQAMVPEGAIVLDNHNGTAPGLILEKNGKSMILLPGPPNELIPMFENQVAPYLRKLQPEMICSAMVKVVGSGESLVETEISDLIANQTNPTIATYAKTGEVDLRVTAKAKSEEEADALIRPMVQELRRRFGKLIFTTEEKETLPSVIVRTLTEKKLTLATAESCTGGMIAAKITDVPGASWIFREGFVTYSNEAKERLLGVRHETLETFGAVSQETAKEMAEGGARAAEADICLSVTGIAGPDGGTKEKPVGLVYIGCCYQGITKVEELHLKGNRGKIRENAAVKALTLLWKCLVE